MKLRCLFSCDDQNESPELILAWDEYSIDENEEGWSDALKKEKERLSIGAIPHAVVTLKVSASDILQRIFPPETQIETEVQ